MQDLFEFLKRQAGCRYISDLRSEPNTAYAKAVLKKIDYTQFSLKDLSDCSEYLFYDKKSIENYEQAVCYFKNH